MCLKFLTMDSKKMQQETKEMQVFREFASDCSTSYITAYSAAKKGYIGYLLLVSAGIPLNWHHISIIAAGNGHGDILELAISKGAYNWENILMSSAMGGYLNIFNRARFVLSRTREYTLEETTWEDVLLGATLGGNMDIFNIALKYSLVPDWDEIICASAMSGHQKIFTFSYRQPNSVCRKKLITKACIGGNMNIINVVTKTKLNVILALSILASTKHKDSFNILMERAKPYYHEIKWDLIVGHAAAASNLSLVKRLESKVSSRESWKPIILSAVGASLETIEYIMHKHSYLDLDWNKFAVKAAMIGKYPEVVVYAIEMGANNYQNIAIAAAKEGNVNILDLISSKIPCWDKIAKISSDIGNYSCVCTAVSKGATNWNEMILSTDVDDRHIMITLLIKLRGAGLH